MVIVISGLLVTTLLSTLLPTFQSTMANLSTIRQDHFFALCTMDDDERIRVHKFSWEREKPPYFEVPESAAAIEGHPLIASALNSSTMKPGGRRNARVYVYKTNKSGDLVLTSAGSLYLNNKNQFVIQDRALPQESAFNESSGFLDIFGGSSASNKSASAGQILQKFSE